MTAAASGPARKHIWLSNAGLVIMAVALVVPVLRAMDRAAAVA